MLALVSMQPMLKGHWQGLVGGHLQCGGKKLYCLSGLRWVFVRCLEAIAEALAHTTGYTTNGRLCSTPQVQAKVTRQKRKEVYIIVSCW